MQRLPSVIAPDLPEVLDLERQVWEALVRGDQSADAKLLHADFLGVYPSGFAGRDQHVQQLDTGPSIAAFEMHDARLVVLKPDTVLLAYLAVFRRPTAQVDEPSRRMYVWSLWQHFPEGWLNVFSQDTDAA
jgi:hypothetical protein